MILKQTRKQISLILGIFLKKLKRKKTPDDEVDPFNYPLF
jgi:hypothetical protein